MIAFGQRAPNRPEMAGLAVLVAADQGNRSSSPCPSLHPRAVKLSAFKRTGDYLSGRALPSHGRGRRFDPCIPHHTILANRRRFRASRNLRNSGRLVRRVAVCEPNSDRSPAVRAQYHPPVSACKIPFPELPNGSGWTETAGTPTWRQQAVEDSVDQPSSART